jgi:hypothetical protein
MVNPIRNVERNPGPGGPEGALEKAPLGEFDPQKHRPHNYPVKRMATGVRMPQPRLPKIKLQEGGDVEEPDQAPGPDPQDLREPDDQLSPRDQQLKEVVVEAMAALRGQHPDPKRAIQRFIDTFGQSEFRELEQMVSGDHPEPDEDDQGGPSDNDADNVGPPQAASSAAPPAPGGMQVGGLLHGPGTGQDDQIEARTPTGRRVLLSDGEYVIDAPTVAVLGDGSTDAGARRLDQFREAVRRQAYGHTAQAKPMSKGGKAALLDALNR